MENLINDQKEVNTVLRTTSDIRNVQRRLCDIKGELNSIEQIRVVFNEYLAELFISIRKKDGSDYEPISLECIRNSIERHLKEKGYQVSLNDRVFHRAIIVLQAKKRELAKRGKGKQPNKSEHLTSEEEDEMYQCGPLEIPTQ